MSTRRPADPPPGDGPVPALAGRLHHLLKHAQLRLAGLTGPALAPFGISGRECAVLMAIDERTPPAQQEVAERMGVDRTTMVSLIDGLEAKGLVRRRPAPDRRKNVVVLTEVGRTALDGATKAGDEAERRFLSPLSGEAAAALRAALRAVAFPEAGGPAPPPR